MTHRSRPVDERVLGPNPFLETDPRHSAWVKACRLAAEEEALTLSKTLDRIESQPEELLPAVLLDGIASVFDIRAKYVALLRIGGYEAIPVYEAALVALAEQTLPLAVRFCPSFIPRDVFLGDVRVRLQVRSAHWRHHALNLARESENNRTGPTISAAERDREVVGGPKLAAWLNAEMEKRGHMTVTRVHVLTGVDRKTINAMRDGKRVRKIRLRMLVTGLSTEGLPLTLSDVPTDEEVVPAFAGTALPKPRSSKSHSKSRKSHSKSR